MDSLCLAAHYYLAPPPAPHQQQQRRVVVPWRVQLMRRLAEMNARFCELLGTNGDFMSALSDVTAARVALENYDQLCKTL